MIRINFKENKQEEILNSLLEYLDEKIITIGNLAFFLIEYRTWIKNNYGEYLQIRESVEVANKVLDYLVDRFGFVYEGQVDIMTAWHVDLVIIDFVCRCIL
jgi:hypothetical protein